MVATRKSLSKNPPPSSASASTSEVPKFLRELEIDGEGLLKGGRKPKQQAQEKRNVYYWRGCAYEITADTPQEWIDAGRKPSKKRALDDEEEDEDEDETPPAKKARQSPLEVAKYVPRPPKQQRRISEPVKETKRPSAEPKARSSGLQTEMLPPPRPAQKTASKPKPAKITKPTKTKTTTKPPTLFPGLSTVIGEDEARSFATTIVKIAKLNTRISGMKQDFLEARRDGSLEREVDGLRRKNNTTDTLGDDRATQAEEDEEEWATTNSDATDGAAEKDPEHDTNDSSVAQTQQPTPDIENDDQSQDIDADEAIQPDPSVTSEEPQMTYAAANLFASDPTRTQVQSPPESIPDLPDTDRGGNKLRWSLTDKLKNKDRAESAIFKGRMTGESKSARRRRIKREVALIQSLADGEDLTPEDATLGATE